MTLPRISSALGDTFLRSIERRFIDIMEKWGTNVSLGLVIHDFSDPTNLEIRLLGISEEIILSFNDGLLVVAIREDLVKNDNVILVRILGQQSYIVIGRIENNRFLFVGGVSKLSSTFVIDSVGIKTVTIPHGLPRIPNIYDCQVTVVEDTVVNDWAFNLLKITSVNATNVIVKIKISIASLTSSATAKLSLRISPL